MGSNHYIRRQEKERLLSELFEGNYNHIVRLIGTDKETNKSVKGAYHLFEELNTAEILKYARRVAEENNIKLSKIEVISLNRDSPKEIQI